MVMLEGEIPRLSPTELEKSGTIATETTEKPQDPVAVLKGEITEKIKGLEESNPERFDAANKETARLAAYSEKERQILDSFTRGDKETTDKVIDSGDLYRYTEFLRKLNGATEEDLKNDPELAALKHVYSLEHDEAQQKYSHVNEKEAAEKILAAEREAKEKIEYVLMSDINQDVKELEGYLDLFKGDTKKMEAIQQSLNEARRLGEKRDQYDKARQEAVHNNQPEDSIESIIMVRDEWARRYEEMLDSVRDDINDALWERDRRREERSLRQVNNPRRASSNPIM